ncbi:exodeoxyribonuclease VII large subunit [Thioalkalivibrio sp. XN279]|uniref:exodeoxyribonuclease VII large subunit n=1 Tax=Thioalkalivibrio sp. XN279 TaxID=2714953 RepID=UPI0014097B2D|nr:exodeoxyribonuclease VII large subunit [Thioalkalivibrio sp. XN279]NHA15620.1 exodeoxyribonuclease VII large subunit [Thioalkalivibrio sp. XN279]
MSSEDFELPERDVWTVARLNREVRLLLETGLPALWIEGEVSNLARPASGHVYFSLKDEAAQVRCVMWRSTALKLAVSPRNGMQLLLRARLTVYEPRGEYQLVTEYAEEAGEGALRRRFEALKAKLLDEGLFAESAKRPLPRLPRRIGVITSPSGAAVRDILHVLRRRFPAVPVIIYPTPVQGDGAAAKIAAALATASQRAECDVLILARGGGSLEDLWSFNEEVVARAIRASDIPVVSGIGHEVDFTIADFAADLRAPTPSGAAELVVPDALEWLRRLNKDAGRLRNAMSRQLGTLAQKLDWQRRRLAVAHPGQRLRQHHQRLDELEGRLRRAIDSAIATRQRRLAHAGAVLVAQSPARRVQATRERVDSLQQRLRTSARYRLQSLRSRVDASGHALHTVSPLATLERGYAIATDPRDGTILRDARQLAAGDRIELRLARGQVEAEVTTTHDDPPRKSS